MSPAPQEATFALPAAATLPNRWRAIWRSKPSAVVLLDPAGERVTAAQLEETSAAVARRLVDQGVRPSDRVVLSAAPSLDLVVAYVALLRAGAVVVPANTGYTRSELEHLVTDARPSLVVTDAVERFEGFGLPVVTPDPPDATPDPPPVVALDQAAPSDLAWLCYTSGTTGRPKGAMLTHANLLAGADALIEAWSWTAEDRLILALPLFHMHGLGVGINGTLTAGASVVVLPRFDVDAVLDAGKAHRGTMFFGVPTMYARLAESARVPELHSLRLCVSGSAPLDPDLWVHLRDLAGVEVLERYGMTETVMICTNPLAGPRIPGSVGRPLPGVEIRLGAGGTVEVRGPSVFAGYWGREADTAAAFTDDGWFATGDVGEWGPDGDLRLVGRSSELIISGGYNIYPREVEDALRSSSMVRDAAVVGVPDPVWGERVVAFVELADPPSGLDESELTAHLEGLLAAYKRPRAWYPVAALPRNAMGKVRRDVLRALVDAPTVGG